MFVCGSGPQTARFTRPHARLRVSLPSTLKSLPSVARCVSPFTVRASDLLGFVPLADSGFSSRLSGLRRSDLLRVVAHLCSSPICADSSASSRRASPGPFFADPSSSALRVVVRLRSLPIRALPSSCVSIAPMLRSVVAWTVLLCGYNQ